MIFYTLKKDGKNRFFIYETVKTFSKNIFWEVQQ